VSLLEAVVAGLPVVLASQQIGDQWLPLMNGASSIGYEAFYLLLMPALFWCWDAGLGVRIGFILLTSALLNASLKLVFALPRPTWVSAAVEGLAHETTFGLPSGHAQNAVAVWGRLALGLERRWALPAAAGLTGLISFSRLYLGVHFPLDVVAGWVVGALVLASFIWLEAPVWRWLQGRTLAGRLLIVVAASWLFLLLGLRAWSLAAAQPLPELWLTNAAAELGAAWEDPRQLAGLFSVSGLLLGFGLGGVLLAQRGGLPANPAWGNRAGRYAIGAAGVALLYLGLDLISLDDASLFGLGYRYLRYASIGSWISFGAPWVFGRIGLLRPGSPGT
jgi:membrane-associated phospholipid phosphatase